VIRLARERRAYQQWIRKYGTVTEGERRQYTARINEFANKPLISVILPVFNTDEVLLKKCIGSVTGQIYDNWELCIADDASTKAYIRPLLEQLTADERVKVVFREQNGHISAASNSALEFAEGDFSVLLDHDDELSADALFWVANEINEYPAAAMIYSDEDLIDESDRRSSPKFKPDFSRDLLLGINLVTHLSAYRTSILREIGGFRVGFEGSQDYDLALRVVARLSDEQIRHIPKILYHWRITAGSLAHDLESKPYAHESARRAISEQLERTGKKAEVVETGYLHRVRYSLPKELPRVSLILSSHLTAPVSEWAHTVRQQTDYPNLEIVEVDDPESKVGESAGAELVGSRPHWAKTLNTAAGGSGGQVLCFLHAGLRPLSPDWLREMVSFAIQPEIGVVGPKILYRNNTIAGSGLLIGVGGIVGIAHQGFLRDSPGNMARIRLISNYSAISASCLAVRREVFERAAGFDSKHLPQSLFDADLCLRAKDLGLRVLVTSFSELRWEVGGTPHREQIITEKETAYFIQRWGGYVANDPFHNPNLSKESTDFSIEI